MNKGYANMILAVAVVIFVSAVGYFVFFKKPEPIAQQPTAAVKTPVSPAPDPNDETVDWKTYRNEQYGFEVKYPLDFKEQKTGSGANLLSITKTDGGSLYGFGIRVIKNYKIDQIVSEASEVKEINVGNRSGYEYSYIEGAGVSEVALVQAGQDALSISFDLIGDGQNFATNDDRKIYIQDLFNQILSTFKFLN